MSVATAARMNPPPSAGEGGLRSRPGEGNHASGSSGTVLTGALWINVALPLSRLTPFATLPRRGGRVTKRRAPGARP